MNIVLNPFTNTICLFREGNKKEAPVSIQEKANFSLNSMDSCMHAIDEFIASETFKTLKTEKTNLLVIPDFPVAFGTFLLPVLSRFKIHDVFETRFKLCFPNFQSYYLKYREYHRGDEESLYFYTMAKKPDVDSIVSAFEKNGVRITSVDYFGHHIISNLEKKANYPACFLFVGESCSEFVLCKGSEVLSMISSTQGEHTILDKEAYLDSPYFINNDRTLKYAAFMKESLMSKKDLSDEAIDATDATYLEYPKPRALRMLKGQSLEAYRVKNSVKKYSALIGDIINYFSLDPWFIPISEIKVISTDNFFEEFSLLSKEYLSVNLERASKSFEEFASLPGKGNPLFTKTIKKERRSIDWSKFFSMSIGPKKKA